MLPTGFAGMSCAALAPCACRPDLTTTISGRPARSRRRVLLLQSHLWSRHDCERTPSGCPGRANAQPSSEAKFLRAAQEISRAPIAKLVDAPWQAHYMGGLPVKAWAFQRSTSIVRNASLRFVLLTDCEIYKFVAGGFNVQVVGAASRRVRHSYEPFVVFGADLRASVPPTSGLIDSGRIEKRGSSN